MASFVKVFKGQLAQLPSSDESKLAFRYPILGSLSLPFLLLGLQRRQLCSRFEFTPMVMMALTQLYSLLLASSLQLKLFMWALD